MARGGSDVIYPWISVFLTRERWSRHQSCECVSSIQHRSIQRGQQLVLNICILKKRQKRRKATVRQINSYSSFVFFCFVSTFFFNKTCEKLYTIFTIIIWQDHGRTFPCDRTSVRTDLGLAKPPFPEKTAGCNGSSL